MAKDIEQLDAPAEEIQEEQAEPALDPVVEELKSAKDQLLRLAAEFDNYKKRSQKEREEAWLNAKAELFKAFLPVMDNFSRAAEAEANSVEDYKKGVDMIFAQFAGVFADSGAAAFGKPGEPFDPVIHNAVVHIKDESLGANVIAAVYSKGWRVKDRVIREAMVGVAN